MYIYHDLYVCGNVNPRQHVAETIGSRTFEEDVYSALLFWRVLHSLLLGRF